MEDKIIIRDLLLRTIIGLNDWEREKKQDVVLNITLYIDIKKPGQSDDIKHTTNYKAITKHVIDVVENSDYKLLEKLVSHVAYDIVNKFDVKKTTVSIDKLHALRFSRSVALEITREKHDFE